MSNLNPFKRKGWKETDTFQTIKSNKPLYDVGDIIKLRCDDLTNCPEFINVATGKTFYIHLDHIVRIKENTMTQQLNLEELKLRVCTAENELTKMKKMIEEAEKAPKKVVSLKDLPDGTVVSTSNKVAYLYKGNGYKSKHGDGTYSENYWLDISNHPTRKIIEQKEFTFTMPTADRKCPVPNGVRVEVVLRNGKIDQDLAVNYVWYPSSYPDSDILAYRIIGLADGYVLGE